MTTTQARKRSRDMRAAAVLALALMLTGCSLSTQSGAPESADDPRDGRVTLTFENGWGAGIYDWKICVGPDLLVHVGGKDRWVDGSPECTPRTGGDKGATP